VRNYLIAIAFCSGAFAQKQQKQEMKPEPVIVKPVPPLTAAASEAVSLAKDWQDGDPLPTPRENGTVVYRYGAAMPAIICAPERLTTIMLEPGERVQSPPVMGDTARWDYQLMTAGEGPTARTSIVLKPKRPDISTDLVIATNRRSYQLQLVSKAREHLSQIEFSYPATGNFLEYQAEQQKLEAQRNDNTVAELQGRANFAYSVKSKQRSAFMPRAVYDDTHHTFLKMPPEAKDWDTAVLQAAGPNGCEIVNYRVNGDTWIIDRLFTSAELVSGTGKKAQRVSIKRDGAGSIDCGNGKIEAAKK
jgi:type IV secretion system protein TrbG